MGEKRIPKLVFDYAFLVAEGERETVAVLVIRNRRTNMLFGHAVPRKGMAHEHGSKAMFKDLGNPWYEKAILQCDEGAAWRSVHEEVQRRREGPTIGEKSGLGRHPGEWCSRERGSVVG